MTGSRLSSAIDGRIFVVGVPRSGTTLVQALLAAHGAVASFTESHLFDRHFVFLPGLGRPILTRDPGPRLREFLAENGEEAPAAAEEFAAAGGGLCAESAPHRTAENGSPRWSHTRGQA